MKPKAKFLDQLVGKVAAAHPFWKREIVGFPMHLVTELAATFTPLSIGFLLLAFFPLEEQQLLERYTNLFLLLFALAGSPSWPAICGLCSPNQARRRHSI